jgi:hypothetical protein
VLDQIEVALIGGRGYRILVDPVVKQEVSENTGDHQVQIGVKNTKKSGDSVVVCKHRPARVNIALNWLVRCPKMISHHIRHDKVSLDRDRVFAALISCI